MIAHSDGIPAGIEEARSGLPQLEESEVHPPVDPRRWRTLALLGLVQFILVIDGTVVNIALPGIGADLKLGAVGLAWVVNGYLVMAGGARNTIAAALVIVAIGMFLLARIEAPGSLLAQLVPATLVLGLGLGLVNPATANAALHRVSAADAGLASGVQTTVQQVGSATGISILVALAVRHKAGLIANGSAPVEATVAGYRLAFTIAGVVLLLGAVAVMAIMERATDVAADSASPPLPISEDLA